MLELDNVIELKKLIKDKYNEHMHMHDACGGQFFDFDTKIVGIEDFVNDYLASIDKKAEFSPDGLSFTVK